MKPEPKPQDGPVSDIQPVVEQRIDKIVVVVIRTTYVDGRPVREDPSEQTVLFRATVPDVWGFLDKALNESAPKHRRQ